MTVLQHVIEANGREYTHCVPIGTIATYLPDRSFAFSGTQYHSYEVEDLTDDDEIETATEIREPPDGWIRVCDTQEQHP